MRNLKRVLSLALAALMLMGMMVVGAGAASKDFTDASEIKNVEAVDVMVALGVLEGGDKGDFQPNSILTREQAAKIICYLLLGEEAAEKLTTNYAIFSDVPANRWSAPYISYCVNLGILAGDGNGHFFPEGKLTGVAFAKMLLVCLGYAADRENYVGNNWEINTSAAAISTGIAPKALDLSKELSRQDAAQMAFNTLQATMVEYLNDNTIIIGNTTVSTVGKASAVRQSPYTDTMGIENLQFAEKYFGNLKKIADTDEFQRPATTWIYKSNTVGTYVDNELMIGEYTTGVTGKEMYNLLTSGVVNDKDYVLNVYVDGAQYTAANKNSDKFIKENFTRNNGFTMEGTGDGVLTQVFVNSDTKEITVAIINTYLAQATADYNKTTKKLAIRVYNTSTGTPKTLLVDDFAQIADVKEGDFMLVNWADEKAAASYKDVVAIRDVETLSNVTVSKFSIGNYVTVDGTQYNFAASQAYDASVLNDYDKGLLTNKTYNVYLDQYGYAIGVDLYSGEANYVFITGYDLNTSNIANQTADAAAIFLDGTMKTIKVNVKDTNANITTWNNKGNNDYKPWNDSNDGPKVNTWYTYTLDESNSVYTLNVVDAANQLQTAVNTSVTMNSKNVRLDGSNDKTTTSVSNLKAYGNDDSVYLTVGTDTINGTANVINEVTGMYTGIQNVDITSRKIADTRSVFAVMDKNQYVIGAVVIGEDNGATTNYTYIFSGAKNESKVGDTYYWEFDAVTAEGIQTLTVKTKYQSVINTITSTLATSGANAGQSYAHGYLFKLSYDADGYVVNAKLYDDATLSTSYIFANDTSGWNTAINSQIVRYMNVNATSGNQLKLIGNTLYNFTKTSDVGLPLHPDAKFVVAQKEYGKFVKTEYDSIEAALSALYDFNPNTDTTLDFQGTISAVLDNSGRATWVVFDSNGGFNADQNLSNPGTTASKISTVTYENGNSIKVALTGAAGNLTAKVSIATATAPGVYGNYGTVTAPSSGTDWHISVNGGALTAGTYSVKVELYNGTDLVESGIYTVTA